jgi:hypothetical protein
MRETLSACVRAVQVTASFLFLGRITERSPRPLGTALGLTAVVTTIGLILGWRLLHTPLRPLPNDQHACISLETAVHRARFGTISHRWLGGTHPSITQFLPGNASILDQPIRTYPESLADSVEEYRRALIPSLNNENSLMLLDLTVLRLIPNITLIGMARAHLVLKVCGLLVFVLLLLRSGASPVFSLVAFLAGLLVIGKVSTEFPISLYSFLMPTTAALVGALGLALSLGTHHGGLRTLAVLTGIGFFAGWFFNLRTSYLPVILALFASYLAFAAWDLRRQLGGGWAWIAVRTGLAVAGFVVGFQLFGSAFIQPIKAAMPPNPGNATYHVIGHPLVLGLGEPPSPLSQREGIRYADAVGLEVARRIDPSVTYLGQNYDRALLVYYVKLWLYYPEEMLDTYWMKLSLAGPGVTHYVIQQMKGRAWHAQLARRLIAPLRSLSKGSAYLALFLALTIAGAVSVRFLNLSIAFALTALALTGTLLLIESAIFEPFFVIYYHNFLLFWCLLCGLLCYQVILNVGICGLGWLVRLARRWLPVKTGAPAIDTPGVSGPCGR